MDWLDILIEQTESTADWRRGLIAEYPDDPRNREAANQLDRVAATLTTYIGTPLGDSLATIPENADVAITAYPELSDHLRGISFRPVEETAVGLIEWFRDRLVKLAA